MRLNVSACGILAAGMGMLLLPSARLVWAEDVTVTTYYPSPRGVYEELRTSGDVGIGTIGAVSERLQVEGGDLYVVTGDVGIGTPPNFGGGALELPVTGAIEFVGGGRITSSASRIEIGTSGLTHDLKVWGSEQIGGLLAFDDGAGNFDVEVTHGAAPRTLQLGRAGLLNSLLVNTDTFFADGGTDNVGIGTITPLAKLDILQTGASNAFRVQDQAADPTPFRVDSAGNVFVGGQFHLEDIAGVAGGDMYVSGGGDGIFYIMNTHTNPPVFPNMQRIVLIFQDAAGGAHDLATFHFDRNPSLEAYTRLKGDFRVESFDGTQRLLDYDIMSGPVPQLTVIGEATFGGVANDGTGKVVCIKADKTLGTCDNAPDAMGQCFCQ